MIYGNKAARSAGCIAAAVLALPALAHAAAQHVYSFQGGRDGAYPNAGLVTNSAGNLYGTTIVGGATNNGTVFKATPGGTEAVLYSFKGGSDGASPYATLTIDAKGNLYGTTFFGGTRGVGTVFKLTPGGQETVLHSFQSGHDGANPAGSVIMDAQGNLYGTTEGGGAPGYGTVFKVTPIGTEAVLHSFVAHNDGAFPSGGLIADSRGNMYGTTGNGGATGNGIIFEVTPGGTETVLYTFKGYPNDGSEPLAGFVADTSGNLYGTTKYGDTPYLGTVFKFTPGGTETVLYSFKGGSDGAYPTGGVVIDAHGNLYGTTTAQGAGNCGTAFQLTPGRIETVLQAFNTGANGCYPHGSLVFDQNLLYGTTYGFGSGMSPYGAVFRMPE